MHDLQERLETIGFKPLRQPLVDAQLVQWQAVYRELMTPAYILQLFGLPSEALAAKISSIAEVLAESHFRALQRPDAAQNPFVTTAFANRYAEGEAGLPLYLQQAYYEPLRRERLDNRLKLHQGNVLEQMAQLAQQNGAFDLISLSNIADWMNDSQFASVVTQARAFLKVGGTLLARTATGSRMINQVMAAYMDTDSEFDTALADVERGPWFRTIAVGFRPAD